MAESDVVVTDEEETVDRHITRRKQCLVIDLENNDDDEIVCIAVVNSSTPSTSRHDEHGSNSSSIGSKSRNRPMMVIDVENDGELISVDCDNDKEINKPSTSRCEVNVINIEDEIDEDFDDNNYTLEIKDSPSSSEHVIDLEENSRDHENQQITEKGHDDINHLDTRGDSSTAENLDMQVEETPDTTEVTEATLHKDPNCSTISNTSEIDDYDARVRQYFESDLNSSDYQSAADLTFNSSCFDESNDSNRSVTGAGDSMECDSDDDADVIEINDDEESNDDCIITSDPTSTVRNQTSATAQTTVATIDVEQHHEKKKRKKITETVDEIFQRMMPSCVPGVLSLCASEPNCLPTNIRPYKFCYFYHVSAHMVVKEIQKNEFFKIKDQMLIAKKVVQPCTCLSHPLNQNASKLTLLTNPQSLFHRSQCYFAQNSRRERQNRPKKPKRLRRLTYQVTFCRIPRKRDAKDFKDWADVVIKRRQNSSLNSNADMEDDKIQHQPFVCKSEADSSCDCETGSSFTDHVSPVIKTES